MPDTETRMRETSAVRRALAMIQDLEHRLAAAQQAPHAPMAVVGLGCRFPGGAADPTRSGACVGRGAGRHLRSAARPLGPVGLL